MNISSSTFCDIIIKIDKAISDFSSNFDKHKKVIDPKLSVATNIKNERTVAIFVNDYLKGLLNKDIIFSASEYNIKPGDFSSVIGTLKDEVDNGEDKRKKYLNLYFDGYFAINNDDGATKHIFIEYKMNNKFAYAELATDYLKYKIATFNDESNTAFIYVIFDKKDIYPTIVFSPDDLYYKLEKKVDAKVKQHKIYVYIPKPDSKKEKDENLKIYQEAYDSFCNAIEKANKIEEIGEENYRIYTEKEEYLLQTVGKFNSNIFTSSLFKNNWLTIKKLENLIENKFTSTDPHIARMLSIFHADVISDDDKIFLEDKIIESNSYFYHFMTRTYNLEKDRSRRQGLNSSFRASLYMMSMFDFFSREFFDFDSASLFKYETIKYSNGKTESGKIIAEGIVSNMRYYVKTNSNNLEAFRNIATIICAVYNVFHLYFDLDKDGNVVGISTNREIHRLFESFKKFYYKGKRLIGIKKQMRLPDFSNIDNDKFCSILEDILKINEET